MRDCPTPGCGNVLADNAIVCNACGWEAPRTTDTPKKRRQSDVDPLHGTCEHMDRGQRCVAPGTLSFSTLGSGPWYCAAHFPQFGGYGYTPPAAKPAPSTADLTDAQWYAVCKFFPTIAARAKRPVVPVGPDQPLDAQVKAGPLFGALRQQVRPTDYETDMERAAIQLEPRRHAEPP